MSIIDRIREHGGEVIRDKWSFHLRPGRLDAAARQWIATNAIRLFSEIWPEFDSWIERAALLEFDHGYPRDEAERLAYDRVMKC